MIEVKLGPILSLANSIATIKHVVAGGADNFTPTQSFVGEFEKLENDLSLIGLNMTVRQVNRFIAIVKRSNGGPLDRNGVYAMQEIISRLQDELVDIKVLTVDKRFAGYFGQLSPFGSNVSDTFPEALDDAEAAASCIAVGQGTASVMHLMRVIEVGLKKLASLLDISYAPSWESYLSQISKNIALKHDHKDAQWKIDEPFFRDVNGDLIAIKQSFRNPTMHVVRKFSSEEAEEIFIATNRFMNRICQKIQQTI